MPVIVLSENFISALYERLAVFDTAFMSPVTFYAKPSVELLMWHDCWIVDFMGAEAPFKIQKQNVQTASFFVFFTISMHIQSNCFCIKSPQSSADRVITA